MSLLERDWIELARQKHATRQLPRTWFAVWGNPYGVFWGYHSWVQIQRTGYVIDVASEKLDGY